MAFREKQEIGDPLPAFSLPPVDEGAEQSLAKLLDGKRGALIVFWSGVCSHCVRYDGYFNSFRNRHPELGFVAVASRVSESRVQMLSSIRERDLEFPILLDDGAKLARLWYSQQTPRCYLVSPDYKLHYRGAIDNFKMPADPDYRQWLEPAIAQFLAGEPIARPETASFGCAIETTYYKIPSQL